MRRRLTAFAVVVLLMGACWWKWARVPSTAELAAKYAAAPGAYARLKEMIARDGKRGKCFAVGFDRIGDSWEYRGVWTDYRRETYGRTYSLQGALQAAGLDSARYEEYKALLAEAGGERVSTCKEASAWPRAEVLVYRRGMVTGGCAGEIEWHKKPPELHGGDYREVIKVDEYWYLIYECGG